MVSPGTTVLVGEIATLKSKLESALKDSALSVMRVAEADKRIQEADKKAHDAEVRAREAENTLHDLAGKAAIDNMVASRRVAELEARIAPLEAQIAALHQSLQSVTVEFETELAVTEKSMAKLKAILAARNSLRAT